MARFANLSELEIDELEQNKDAESTKKVVEKSVRTFRAFLAEKNESINFEDYNLVELKKALRLFYANARTKKGELYKVTSIVQLRYGLSKFIQSQLGYDILGAGFEDVNGSFSAMRKELTRRGKGDIVHHPPISESDMKKLYEHPLAFKTRASVGLQNKVMFEVILFMCRRGRENLHSMNKDFYGIFKDDEGKEYVEQKQSEVNKNHSEKRKHTETTGEGRMYERPGDPMCPVASYKSYTAKLNPNCDALWQRPADAIDDDDANPWYTNRRVGVNTIAKFMSELSKMAKLSVTYTNHSIRATSITMMDNAGMEARHIMRVSGHR